MLRVPQRGDDVESRCVEDEAAKTSFIVRMCVREKKRGEGKGTSAKVKIKNGDIVYKKLTSR